MSKVADIFARLGLKVDKAEFQQGTGAIDRLATGAQTQGQRVGRALAGIQSKIVGLAAGFGVAMAARDAFGFQQGLEDLDIASRGSVGSLESVRSKILEVSNATGVAKDVILAGTANFVALTGDGKAAAEAMETFAKVTSATGSEMSDVTGASAALIQNLGIMPAQFEKAFSVLISSGKAGAIELKEMSSLFASLTPAASKFAGGAGVAGLAKISAALQLSRQGAGSAAEAATQLEALMGAVSGTAAKRLRKEGVEVFNKDGTLKEFDAIVDAIQAKGFRRDKLIEIFGRKEAVAAFESLTKVEGAWKGLTDQSMEANDLAEDYAKRQAMASVKLTKAWNKFKNAMTKVFGVIVKAIAPVAEHISDLVEDIYRAFTGMGTFGQLLVGTAVAAAAAWSFALLPFILLAAGIAAIALVLEDLWVAFRGGRSVFKDIYVSAKHWIGDMIQGVVDDSIDALRRKFDFIPGVAIDLAAEKANRQQNYAIDRANRSGGAIERFNKRRLATSDALKATDFGDATVDEVLSTLTQEYNRARLENDSGKAAGVQTFARERGLGARLEATINITGVAGLEETARVVEQVIDSKTREMDAASGATSAW